MLSTQVDLDEFEFTFYDNDNTNSGYTELTIIEKDQIQSFRPLSDDYVGATTELDVIETDSQA